MTIKSPSHKQLISDAHLRAIIETSIEGIITIDGAGIVQSFNPAAEKLFYYQAFEVIGSNVSMLMPSPYHQEHDTYLDNYHKSGNAKIIGVGRELKARRKDGSIISIWLSIAEFFEDEKKYFTGFIQDITDLNVALERSRLYQEEFEIIFENAPTGVAIMDLEGLYKNVNPPLCDILGYSKPELLSLNYLEITHPDDIEVSKNFLQKMLQGELAGCSLEKRYLRKDKKVISVILNVAIVHENVSLAHDDKGNPALLISHILDVTEEIEAEEKARFQQEQLMHMDRVGMMGEMAAGIAHEINQPLTAIDAYAQAAQRRLNTDEVDFAKLEELLQKISNASVRAGDVIVRMRDLVKRQSKPHESFDINLLIKDAVQMIKTDTHATEFEIELQLMDALPNAMADDVQVQQVVMNLVRNAMDAESKEGVKDKKIIISSLFLAENKRIQVSVKDFGSGIDEKAAEQLFSPFFTTKSSGMGMGLSICQSIIQLHGGKIWFTQNIDKGTSFHFTLPTVLEENE